MLGLLVLAACADGVESTSARRPSSFRGPIVLVSFSAMRADRIKTLGGSGPSPNVDRLAGEASWVGTAVAATSRSAGSMASVFTGLPPSLHGVAHGGRPRLRPEVRSLAEELGELGFSTRGAYFNPWLGPWFAMHRGFDRLRLVKSPRPALRMLRRMPDGPAFLWVQIPLPLLPSGFVIGTADGREVRVADLVSAPEGELPQSLLAEARALYQERVAQADRMLGRLLKALAESGVYDKAVLVVLSDHGEELGEQGRWLHGESLARAAIEVPLILRLPPGLDEGWRPRGQGPVPLAAIFATLVELAGGRPVPAAARSLWRSGAADARSELFFVDGEHELSLVAGRLQLRWQCRFAPPSSDFRRLRREALDGLGSPGFAALVAAHERRFRSRPGCSLGETRSLVEWLAAGATRTVENREREKELEGALLGRAHFPPPWSHEPPPPGPSLRPGQLLHLLRWGIPADPAWIAGRP